MLIYIKGIISWVIHLMSLIIVESMTIYLKGIIGVSTAVMIWIKMG